MNKIKKRKVCVVTSSRADYGLLRLLMKDIKNTPSLNLQIIATGSHFLSEFGMTYKEIEGDGFTIDSKVEIDFNSDSSEGISESMGNGLIKFSKAISYLLPDLIIVLGDRYEIFSLVSAAHVARIPIAHIHGGETTEGSMDEAFRHSITKMSHLHFVATDTYKKRVLQLGEQTNRVFNVGGLGVDSIKCLKFLNQVELEKVIDFKFGDKNLLITFHPATLDINPTHEQLKELLDALRLLTKTKIIFTLPNADKDSLIIIKMIKEFVSKNDNTKAFSSLGQLLYLSCMKIVDGVIGNSSSALLEAPTLKKGAINIGDRQRGRIQATSVINCKPKKESICRALEELYSSKFIFELQEVTSPYGSGGASKEIVQIIESYNLKNIQKKKFNDL